MSWCPGEMMTQKVLRVSYLDEAAWWIRTTAGRLLLVRRDAEIVSAWKRA